MRSKIVLKTLWHLRFEKMVKLEDNAAGQYQEILDECMKAFGEDHSIVQKLKVLVKEESNHKKMAEELIRVCHATHPEIDVL